jgi:hypothetical protein
LAAIGAKNLVALTGIKIRCHTSQTGGRDRC